MAFPKEFFQKVYFEKKSADDEKRMKNFPGGNALIALKMSKDVINLSSAVVIIIDSSRVDI